MNVHIEANFQIFYFLKRLTQEFFGSEKSYYFCLYMVAILVTQNETATII